MQECFLGKGAPRESEVERGFNSRYACAKKASATHKIPVASREDAAAMREQGETTLNNISSLKDPKLADMLDARADLSETEEDRDSFVFLRTL